MNLVQWAAKRNEQLFREAGKTTRTGKPRKRKTGAYMELCRDSGVSYMTVLKAARDGLPVLHETAVKLSEATGDVVPVDVIRDGVRAKLSA